MKSKDRFTATLKSARVAAMVSVVSAFLGGFLIGSDRGFGTGIVLGIAAVGLSAYAVEGTKVYK